MMLAAPEWLLLLPLCVIAAWLWPALGLRRPLRALCALLLMLVLARPMARVAGDGIDLWVLVDRSASAAEAIGRALPEWEAILQRSRGASDRLRFVDFAAAPLEREKGDNTALDAQETRLALAVQFALGQLAPERLARILVLTDGYATEPLTPVLEPLVQSGAPLDFRLAVGRTGADFRVAAVHAPQRVQPGETFLLDAQIVGAGDAELAYELALDGRKIGQGTATVRGGEARLRFAEKLRAPGAHRYSLRILPAAGADAHSENNEGTTWVETMGGARVLLVTAFEQDPLAEALRRQGYAVEQVTDPSRLHVGALSGARVIVFNNVPSHRVPDDFLRGLDFHVREQGAGLLMCGGKFSFGSGGYFASPLDPLLPVSMELRKEHRKLRVAMAIVMDRSGSMAVSVPHGGRTVTKMELADEGAARAVELLGDSDLISVFAVDSEAHRIVGLTEVGPARADLIDTVRRIRSEGGGIFVYEGLKAGWEELQQADVGQRHLILFSDANDSEEPGAYQKLLDEMTAQGATVSVIGLGRQSDADAKLLEDIARRGKGRMIFNENAADLPALFAQETVAVARSAFLKDAVPLKPTAGWLEIAASPLAWPAQADGYNLSYLKPGATTAAISGDEYAAPLVAFWQRGLGRSAAVSFPLAGEHSDTARAWPQYGEFVVTLGRWLSGEDVPAGLGITARVTGTELELDLFYDGEEWAQRIAADEPKLVLSAGEEPGGRAVAWDRIAPGHFRARAALRPGERVRGAAQIGRVAMPFGPVTASSNAEWQFRPEALAELRSLSALTGGRERLDLATTWEAPPRPRFTDLRAWLLGALLVLVVADALATRVEGV